MSEKDKLKKYHQQQQQQQIYDSSFDYTLPRPPVVGEERANYVTEWIPQSAHLSSTTTSMDRITAKYQQKPSSPIPRYDEDACRMAPRSSPQHHHHHHHHHHHDKPPPACLTWAHSLHNLLQDADGVKLFLRYLEAEGAQHANSLHFWFACEGLKNHNEIEKIQRLVKLIYKTYFVKSALPISDELRKDVTKNMKSPQCLVPPVTIFDEAQVYIERLINNTTYPNFLKSDIYLQYLQSVQNPNSGSSEDFSSESSSSSSSASNKDLTNLASGIGPLPTLHEGMEFMTKPQTIGYSSGHHTPTLSSGPLRLTKNMLLRSQNYRAQDIRPKSETFAGLFKCRGDGAHAAYNSYNPVSRQDSEMQSLSSHSDVRTDSDNMSLAESYIDSKSSGWSHGGKSNSARYARQLAALNKETDIHQTFIPRTQRIDIKAHQMDFAQHAAILKEKLENVKREQENEELLDRKLKEGDSSTCPLDDKNKNELQSRELENAIREKLQFQDDNDQDILDEHVSRVFSDPSLAMSPSLMSPRPLSPHKRRSRRREKDVFSTFSGDSGNVHDFPEMLDTTTATTTMVKSRSVPEYCDERFVRTSSCRRSSSKKTLAELTDSGVSVVSETPSGNKKIQVLHWLMDSGRGSNNNNNNNNGSSGGGSNIGRTAVVTTSSEMAGTSLRDNNRKYRRNYGSRSNSLERSSVTDILGPAQPFMADPSMPPPPPPNTSMQLEEARRRLLENDVRVKSRQRFVKYYPDMVASSSSQSTLKKQTKPLQRPPINSIDDTTTVVFSFCDEQFPYRTKIPGTQITLRQFKEYLPKKGNYRFFFKTVCEDLDNQVTHEEVSNDNEVLPLWEGKIMAQVKPIFDIL